MSSIDEAADALRVFAEGLRPVFDVADRLKEMGSIENATRERKEALARATAEHEEAVAENTRSVDRFHRALAAQAETLAANVKKAASLLEEADAAAERIVAEANAKAVTILAEARIEVERATKAHAAEMAEIEKQLMTIKEEAANALARRDEAVAHHGKILKSVEEMKEAARRVG